MADPLPKFDAPPVVETVLSVQFAPIANFTGAHAGWFWKSHLVNHPGDWRQVLEVQKLDEPIERFGAEEVWKGPGITFETMMPVSRFQFIRADEARMIQLQNTRFILNWKKAVDKYPSFGALLPEFVAAFECFRRFLRDAELGELALNQWEMTYVNLFDKGELWQTPRDISEIFSQIHIPEMYKSLAHPETILANWRYVLGDNQGRLHVSLANVRIPPENKESLRLQFVARGGIAPGEVSADKYFNFGHEAVVRSFAAITSEKAQKVWKRTQ